MTEIEFLMPGTPVVFGPGPASVHAMVTKVMVEGKDAFVTYEVAWLAAGQRYAQWVQAFEIQPEPAESARLGFAKRCEESLP